MGRNVYEKEKELKKKQVKSNYFREILIGDLRLISERMKSIGLFMEFYGGFGEIGEHGREMIGASKIAAGWADGIEKEDASDSKKAPSATKLKEQAKATKARRRAVVQKPSNRPEKPRSPKLQRVPKK